MSDHIAIGWQGELSHWPMAYVKIRKKPASSQTGRRRTTRTTTAA
jgi:hypothetical protein